MTSLLRSPCQSISDAFCAFCLRVYVTFLTCSLYPQQKRAYSVLHREWELFCLTSTQTRMFIRDGDKGEGDERVKAQSQAPTRKTKNAVDRRQNNRMLRQCPLAIAQQLVYHAITVPILLCGTESRRQCP